MASVQRRRGPNVVGLYGILQPLIDAVKLLLKEVIIPDKVNQILFVLGPVITLVISLTL
jgi:NADH-ubiquinone oxidoreductase chain 1